MQDFFVFFYGKKTVPGCDGECKVLFKWIIEQFLGVLNKKQQKNLLLCIFLWNALAPDSFWQHQNVLWQKKAASVTLTTTLVKHSLIIYRQWQACDIIYTAVTVIRLNVHGNTDWLLTEECCALLLCCSICEFVGSRPRNLLFGLPFSLPFSLAPSAARHLRTGVLLHIVKPWTVQNSACRSAGGALDQENRTAICW